jgi:putative protease
VDSVIISDLGLFLAAREDHPEARLCASTGMVALNSESVGFLSQLGASRVILERQLGIGEVRRIKEAHPGVELEAFILNGRCRNIEGFCTFQHGHQDVLHPVHPAVGRVLYRAMHHPLLYSVGVRLPRWMTERGPVERAIAEVYNPCRFTYEVGVEGPAACAASERIRSFLGRKVQAYCGGCALHELWEAGVDAVKVVGRIFPTSRRVEDTRFIAGLLRRLREERPAREEFHAMAREAYRSRFGVACDFESCYYPDAGWAGGP